MGRGAFQASPCERKCWLVSKDRATTRSDTKRGVEYEVTVTSEPQHRVRAYIDMKGGYRKYGPVSFSTVPGGGVGEVVVVIRVVTHGGLWLVCGIGELGADQG